MSDHCHHCGRPRKVCLSGEACELAAQLCAADNQIAELTAQLAERDKRIAGLEAILSGYGWSPE